MQVGLALHQAFPMADLQELRDAPSYAAAFHYWLNRTTAITAGAEQFRFSGPLEVDGGSRSLVYSTTVLGGGLRYHFLADFLARPYIEGGLGYQFWTIDPQTGVLDKRNGGSVAYFTGAGLYASLSRNLGLNLGARFYYFPMNEKIETKIVSGSGRKPEVKSEPLENAGFASAGVELVWRFK